MKKILFLIPLICVLNSCNSQSNTEIVEDFIRHYNEKDSVNFFNGIQDNFIQTWEITDTVIRSKASLADNYAWGVIMEDREEIELLKTTDSAVEVLSHYYCFRDSILNLGPYECLKTFYLKDGKVAKIEEHKSENWENLMIPRREKYNLFFLWLESTHYLNSSDLPFNRDGALLLKKMLVEFSEQ